MLPLGSHLSWKLPCPHSSWVLQEVKESQLPPFPTLQACSVRAVCFCPSGRSWKGLSGMMIRVGAEPQFPGEPVSIQGVSHTCPGLWRPSPSSSSKLLLELGWSWGLRHVLTWSSFLVHPATGMGGTQDPQVVGGY